MTRHLSMRSQSVSRRERDAGLTLVEMIVALGMVGLIAAVIAASITVVFRTEEPVVTTIHESHDVQQAVNYFHLDVESGPRLITDFRATSGAPGIRGTGCNDAGSGNVMRFDVKDEEGDPNRRIAYLLTTTGSTAQLDRYECDWDSLAMDWDTPSTLNIADQLDASGGPAVSVTVIPDSITPTKIDRVTMQFAQSIADNDFSAAPRAEIGLAAGPPAADCTDDPLSAALGFGLFIEGEIDMLVGPVTGSIASHGTIAWEDTVLAATVDANTIVGFDSVAFYTNTGFNWSSVTNPAGLLTTLPGGSNLNIVVGGSDYDAVASGSLLNLYEAGLTTGRTVETRGDLYDPTAYPISFDVQFEELRACADVIGLLPDGADAEHITPQDGAGGSYIPGSGNLFLEFGGNRTQVLNLTEDQLPFITTVDKTSGSPLAAQKPLIVNISESQTDGDDDLTWDFVTTSWENVGAAKFVLYNFPNTTGTLFVDQDVYGTIFAPYASVITRGTVQGNVIADNWTHEGGASGTIVENDTSKMFAATVDWD